ncbi:MAG: FMN-binding protein [Anaerotignum sp.]|nr:FMN-binding protein [Anaerotignum sp.]
MQLLINITLAWVSVGLMLALSIIYLLRVVNKYFFNNQNETMKKWNKSLRKHHKWMGILIIFTGLLHGILSSFNVLSLNFGTILLVSFFLLAFSFMFRRIFKKGIVWMKIHRLLTALAFVLLVFHLVEVGGFVGVEGIKAALTNDSFLNETSTAPSQERETDETQNINTDEVEELAPTTNTDESFKNEAETGAENNTNTNENALPSEDSPNEAASADSSETTTSSSTSGPYIDGTYTGMADGYRPGLTVEVVIENGYISSVEVVAHNEKNERFYGEPVALIPQEIVAAQSTDVDTVTGATFTSNGIKNAVNNALANALK